MSMACANLNACSPALRPRVEAAGLPNRRQLNAALRYALAGAQRKEGFES